MGLGFNPLNVVTSFAGKAAERICDELGAPEWLGDAAKIAIGYKTGNLELIADGVTDLGQNIRSALEDRGLGTAEPAPPPERAPRKDLESERPTSRPLYEMVGRPVAADASCQPGDYHLVTHATPPSAATTSSSSAAPPSDNGNPKETEGKSAAAAFIKQFDDPEAMLTAIKNGDLPDGVANSQTGMMMIQQRLNEIQRMFQMMTQMMQAVHEMSMGIVRNIRA